MKFNRRFPFPYYSNMGHLTVEAKAIYAATPHLEAENKTTDDTNFYEVIVVRDNHGADVEDEFSQALQKVIALPNLGKIPGSVK